MENLYPKIKQNGGVIFHIYPFKVYPPGTSPDSHSHLDQIWVQWWHTGLCSEPEWLWS